MAELGEKNPGAAAGLAAVAVAAAGGMRMPVPTPLGAFPVPGATAAARPRFNLPAPTQTPIVRVNLAKSNQQQPTGYASWAIGRIIFKKNTKNGYLFHISWPRFNGVFLKIAKIN